jgi:iron complex outermembrane receptor protein
VFAENLDANDRFPLIPPMQLDNTLTYKKQSIGKWRDTFISLTSQVVFQQTRSPRTILPAEIENENIISTFDFMDAPKTYGLFRLEIGSKLPLDNKDLTVGVAVENLLDTPYRNYMNRLRYYADEMGRNVSIRLNYAFHTH